MKNIELSYSNLVTLKGKKIPNVVNGDFNCSSNYLTSMEFGPKEVTKNYNCGTNKLTSLEFCAIKIGDSLYVNRNLIENLKDIHKQFKNGYINKGLILHLNPLKSHLLGVILIPKLEEIFISNEVVNDILNKHLKTRDVLDCQEELIQNGYKEFAQL